MHLGYFTRHNLRFKPAIDHADYVSNQDSVHSDIDVIAINPLKGTATDAVMVLSCKAWQSGFDPVSKVTEIVGNKTVSGRVAWKGFRELCVPKWSSAFMDAVQAATGTRKFTYCTVVTSLKNSEKRAVWEENDQFCRALEGNPIRILELKEMLDHLWSELKHTPAASEIGRAVQLMKAANWKPPSK